MATSPVHPFRFDAASHTYYGADGSVLPHITGMLETTGWTDDTWMTEESSERGQIVHALTCDYDLGALEPDACVSVHRGYLLGHVECTSRLRPRWTHIEVPFAHPSLRFGGRPDRLGLVLNRRAVFEIKSGAPTKAHPIQTALQAILAGGYDPLPAWQWARYCEYLTKSGRYKLEEHRDRRDFDIAHDIIRTCAR